ncbi:hypothetical protein KIN20_003015 [Parelaphostrongylus tenuis]|uniref:Uncharacterized protein n=1 Tax=Parelaphostrongylus tenuis TaxID=148309 RepID=A0AAD5LWN4_PARTN|nr:hypothetical protein KIN20_003015 [Parelaphostrongylus tenuis]
MRRPPRSFCRPATPERNAFIVCLIVSSFLYAVFIVRLERIGIFHAKLPPSGINRESFVKEKLLVVIRFRCYVQWYYEYPDKTSNCLKLLSDYIHQTTVLAEQEPRLSSVEYASPKRARRRFNFRTRNPLARPASRLQRKSSHPAFFPIHKEDEYSSSN